MELEFVELAILYFEIVFDFQRVDVFLHILFGFRDRYLVQNGLELPNQVLGGRELNSSLSGVVVSDFVDEVAIEIEPSVSHISFAGEGRCIFLFFLNFKIHFATLIVQSDGLYYFRKIHLRL